MDWRWIVMSHSVIYVLFKSSKRAAPGIEIIIVKDHFIYPVKEQNREHTHLHTQTHKQNTMMPYLVLEKGIHHIYDADCSETSRLTRKYQYTTHHRLQSSILAAILTLIAWLSCSAILAHALKYPHCVNFCSKKKKRSQLQFADNVKICNWNE